MNTKRNLLCLLFCLFAFINCSNRNKIQRINQALDEYYADRENVNAKQSTVFSLQDELTKEIEEQRKKQRILYDQIQRQTSSFAPKGATKPTFSHQTFSALTFSKRLLHHAEHVLRHETFRIEKQAYDESDPIMRVVLKEFADELKKEIRAREPHHFLITSNAALSDPDASDLFSAGRDGLQAGLKASWKLIYERARATLLQIKSLDELLKFENVLLVAVPAGILVVMHVVSDVRARASFGLGWIIDIKEWAINSTYKLAGIQRTKSKHEQEALEKEYKASYEFWDAIKVSPRIKAPFKDDLEVEVKVYTNITKVLKVGIGLQYNRDFEQDEDRTVTFGGAIDGSQTAGWIFLETDF